MSLKGLARVSHHGSAPWMAVLTATIVFGMASTATGDEFQRHVTLDGEQLLLINLIGEIHLEKAEGSAFEAEIEVHGDDASEDLIRIETKNGGHAQLLIRFPVEDERHYVYPRMGRGSKTTFTLPGKSERKGSWTDWIGGGKGKSRKIRVQGRGSGLEVWADVTLKVPSGKDIEVLHGVGAIWAEGVEGDVVLDIASGPITARRIEGDLLADTGSGSVEAVQITGDVKIDTGSGSVEAFEITGIVDIDTDSGGVDVGQITGDVRVDTGSGSVEVSGCAGELLCVDTGSGSVHADRIDCRRLRIDTGNGRVRAKAIQADEASIDTRSGSVELMLDRMGSGRFVVDTGSGSIVLRLPPDASAKITADTGSGSVSADVEATQVMELKSDRISLRVGDGAARVTLDSGSGSIRIYQ